MLILSGLDLITSADVNGVGKSAVLEAFKLALVGEVPGRAKTVDDIMQFTSLDEIKVEFLAETYRGPVNVVRRFLRFAPQGEKRPIRIQGVNKKFEVGSQWVRQHVGAVSISFDPFEFLNLADAKKRQWIIAHSPESDGLGQTALYVFLLARLVENLLGKGIVRSLLNSITTKSLKEFCKEANTKDLSGLKDRLLEVLHQQEPELSSLVRKTLEAVFRNGSRSSLGEENSNAMLKHLKAEILRVKHALRDQVAALACLGPVSLDADDGKGGRRISEFREDIRSLSEKIAGLDKRGLEIRNRVAEKNKKDLRIIFLKENISRLAEKLKGGMSQALKGLREQLHQKRVDPEDIQSKLKKNNRELSRHSLEYQEEEARLRQLAGQLKLKRDKLETLGASHFSCPVATEIRCDTDMAPYRKILVEDIESLQRREKEVSRSCKLARQRVTVCQSEITELDIKLADKLKSNREIQREIDLVEEQIQQEEKETAEAYGKLVAYREEMNAIEEEMNESEPEPAVCWDEEGGAANLEKEKSALEQQLTDKQVALDERLRRQGKIEALSEIDEQKKLWEQELGILKQTFDVLGVVQEEMAVSIARALETEVNDVLKLIDHDYHFTLNLTEKRFEMGWNRDGKVIPFKTINSAHFVIFIVPFLAALIQRLARTRGKTGLPTLKALCIEAESLTPENLMALLKGLGSMKAGGVLDNVLVAHYHSLKDSEKLSGFKEHVLESTLAEEKAVAL